MKHQKPERHTWTQGKGGKYHTCKRSDREQQESRSHSLHTILGESRMTRLVRFTTEQRSGPSLPCTYTMSRGLGEGVGRGPLPRCNAFFTARTNSISACERGCECKGHAEAAKSTGSMNAPGHVWAGYWSLTSSPQRGCGAMSARGPYARKCRRGQPPPSVHTYGNDS